MHPRLHSLLVISHHELCLVAVAVAVVVVVESAGTCPDAATLLGGLLFPITIPAGCFPSLCMRVVGNVL